ncbi:hypothetical protein Psi02_35950 [Planotetraspora silvatica]|uniref:Glycosyltransferase 2-like domain-containing protein n=1 Tax=Planotetraspora silvatica TaxID=234614 RepID=A0A8J3UMK2_9ACTN|nr:glycosyltransferase family A protein [Planotetraspora silvatica]GII47171.1 hypothetical protein Psi02_35950 [Planotetraspora silvatica]
MRYAPRPRIPLNDYGVLGDPPEPGTWTPTLPVSVIVSARGHARSLRLTLAGLAAQSYPAHLLEVIVVDAGDGPPVVLPDRVPERTRVIRPEPGTSRTPDAGAAVADGHVVHLLDADLVLPPEHIEAHMRWHHLADHLVVLSRPRHAPGIEGKRTERRPDRTSDLRAAGPKAFTAMVGVPASVPADLLRASGGWQPSGEYTELGYRLAQAGAVFLAERHARSVRIGTAAEPDRSYLAEHVPTLRRLRRQPRRTHLVPYVEAVVPVGDAAAEDVRATVDGLLASDLHDIVVIVAGPPPGDGAQAIQEAYAGRSRVVFAGDAPGPASQSVPFRFHCPPGWVPSPQTLGSIVAFADRKALGVLSLALDEREGVVSARLERTAAMNRARLLARPGEDLDDLVHETFGTLWEAGETWGIAAASAPRPETSRPEQPREAARRSRNPLRRVLVGLLTRT